MENRKLSRSFDDAIRDVNDGDLIVVGGFGPSTTKN
jgi:acyl CoA:acetate/3-ketoacid CoA transferase alpha subunit